MVLCTLYTIRVCYILSTSKPGRLRGVADTRGAADTPETTARGAADTPETTVKHVVLAVLVTKALCLMLVQKGPQK
jgi:hypothetical protein